MVCFGSEHGIFIPPPPLQCILFLNVCSLVHKHHQQAILSVVDRILHTVPYYASVAWLMFWTQQCTKRILSILNQLHQDFTLNKIGLHMILTYKCVPIYPHEDRTFL